LGVTSLRMLEAKRSCSFYVCSLSHVYVSQQWQCICIIRANCIMQFWWVIWSLMFMDYLKS